MINGFEALIYNRNGVALRSFDRALSLGYGRAANNYGRLELTLPGRLDDYLLQRDNRIAIYLDGVRNTPFLDLGTIWFLRGIQRGYDRDGGRFTKLIAFSALYLLTSRWVAYAAESSQAKKTGHIDDMIKAIVRENFTAATDTARNISTITVAPNYGQAPNTTKGFSWRSVFDVCQDLAKESGQNGVPLFFDFVVTDPKQPLYFTTFTYFQGDDHGPGGTRVVTLSQEASTLDQVLLEEDAENEVNFAYALGTGERDERLLRTAQDATRIGFSIYNRREAVYDASNISDVNALQSEADAAVREGKPPRVLTGRIVNAPGAIYGLDWGFGDRVQAGFEAEIFPARVDAVEVTIDENGRDIRAMIRAES